MKTIQVFKFSGTVVRIVLIDGEPWWILSDICKILGIGNPSDVKKRININFLSTLDLNEGGGLRTIVNEPGLYEVIFRSDKPEAYSFRNWVFETVLPNIRKTGTYAIHKELPSYQIEDPADRALQWAKEYKEHKRLLDEKTKALTIVTKDLYKAEDTIAEQIPKVKIADDFFKSDGLYTMQQAANVLGIGRQTLFSKLRAIEVIQPFNTMPYRKYIDAGLFVVKALVIESKDLKTTQTYVTGKGMEYLHKRVKLDEYTNISRYQTITGETGIQADTTYYNISTNNIDKKNDKRITDKRQNINDDSTVFIDDFLKNI